jgi:hypothetical protein
MTIATGQPLLASDINDLTFFPKGAILIFSSTAWSATSAKFKTIWKVCDKTNHDADPNNVPDLTNRFLRGGSNSDFTTGGGADSQSVTLTTTHLPSHNHEATGLSLGGLSTSGLSIASNGAHTHTLSGGTSEGGSHSHTLSDGSAASAGGHTHTLTDPGHSHTVGRSSHDGNGSDSGAMYTGSTYSSSTNTTGITISTDDGAHTHTVSGTISTVGTHTHDFSSTSSAVSAGSHDHTISGSITGGSISGSTANAGSGTAFNVATLPAYYTVIYIIKVA